MHQWKVVTFIPELEEDPVSEDVSIREASGTACMLTIPEVAARLGVGVRYVRRLVAEHRIPFYKVGYLIRFDQTELEAWLRASHVADVSVSRSA